MNNNDNNINNFDELDELRQQINDLKNKVDQQGHLNEELVKKAIQGKMKGLHSTIFKYMLFCIIVAPFIIWDFIHKHLSWPFIVFTIIMFLGSFIAEYFINKMNVKHMTDDLVETARKLSQMKDNRKKQQIIGFCVLAIWVPWYIYEMYKYTTPQVEAHFVPTIVTFLIIGAIIGVIIGIGIGLHYYHKMQRVNDEMIEQINELTGEQKQLQ